MSKYKYYYKYYYTYLVIPTNKKSSLFGTIYFGQHKTNKLNDNYTASGKLIGNYLKKYPNDYYREIIKFYSSEDELNKAEFDLINPHLNNKYCLNLRDGGNVGRLSEYSIAIISSKSKACWRDDEYRKKLSKLHIEKWEDEEFRKKQNASRKKAWANSELRSKQSEISKKAMTEERRKFYSKINKGEKNPMYGKNSEDYMTNDAIIEKRKKQSAKMKGRKHLHNGINCVFVTPDKFEYYLSQGYIFGQIQKYIK